MLEVGSVTLPYRVMVQVGRSSHVRDELLGRFRARGLEILALIAVAAVAGGFLLTRAALAPLRALEGTVRSILQTGQFDARVPIRNSHDPLDELGARVNEMLERIQSLVGGMRGAIDNVAHDLRTPLTRFRNVAEAALLTTDPERAREGLAQALEEADRVERHADGADGHLAGRDRDDGAGAAAGAARPGRGRGGRALCRRSRGPVHRVALDRAATTFAWMPTIRGCGRCWRT